MNRTKNNVLGRRTLSRGLNYAVFENLDKHKPSNSQLCSYKSMVASTRVEAAGECSSRESSATNGWAMYPVA